VNAGVASVLVVVAGAVVISLVAAAVEIVRTVRERRATERQHRRSAG
jgi:heme exporter protein D